MRLSKHLRSAARLFALAAIVSLPALADESRVELTIQEQSGITTLALGGASPFHATTSGVVELNAVPIPDSAGVAVTWMEIGTNGEALQRYAISLDGVRFARVRETNYVVRLRYANFDPLSAVPGVDEPLAATGSNELYLVQFIVPPLEAFRAEIRLLGGAVQRFLSDHTHIVRMPAGVSKQVARLPYVRWVGTFHPAYKADEEILAGFAFGMADGASRYSIEVLERGPGQQRAVQAAIQAAGGVVHFITPRGFRMEATLTPGQLLDVLHMNEVHVAHPKHFGDAEDMDVVRTISGANFIESTLGYTGQGVRGESFDSGFQAAHQDFTPAPIWRTTTGTRSHGTATYGICFGTGFGRADARGLNPDLEQGFLSRYQVTTQFGGSVTRHSLTQSAVDPNGNVRILFQTSSVGSPRTPIYNSISAEVDDYLFLYDLLSFQSMSNAGGTPDVRPQAWAKNIIGVGGIRHQNTLNRNDDTAAGSSGPAQDGRIKPDLSHFYDNVITTYSTSTTGYGQFSGTSSATPCTAGHSGLFFQMWHEGVFEGHGGGASVFDSRAKMATAKAMLINSAFKYPLNQGDLRRVRQGWGMVDLSKMYDRRDQTFIVDETDNILPLATNTYNLEVPAGEAELAVTMVYTDLMGPTSATLHRINDLSLRVVSPSGVAYWGNNGLMSSHWSTPGGSSNTVDTVENVFVQNPEAGTWVVEIHGDEIIADSRPETPELDADYALVVSGVIPPTGCGGVFLCGDANCDGLFNGGDIDAFFLALGDPSAWWEQYPTCDLLCVADINRDGLVNGGDIDPFFEGLRGGVCP